MVFAGDKGAGKDAIFRDLARPYLRIFQANLQTAPNLWGYF